MIFHRLAPLLGAAALGALLPRRADAQKDTTRAVEVAPISVTAVRRLGAAPPVVTVTVTGERIRDAQATDPYDLVRRLTGIEIHQQGQGPGFAADAVLRGFTSDHSSDVLLVVDGVPINLPVHGHVEGYADWSLLIAPALSEMRIINGPASPRYGDFAFGGVVEAFTDLDVGTSTGALTGSSYGDVGGWLRTGLRGARGGGMAAGEAKRQTGWRDNSDFWLGNGLVRGWHALGRGQLDGGVSFYGSSWNSPGFLSVDQYDAGDLATAADPTDGGDAARLIAQAHYTTIFGNAGFESLVWGQGGRSTVFLNLPEDGVLEQTEERDERLAAGGRAQFVWQLAGGSATAGATTRADAGTYDLYNTTARVRDAEETAYDGDYRSGGAYARWRKVVGTRLALDLGGRIDALHYASLDRLSATPQRVSATDWLASPKVGARLLLSPAVVLLGSFSRGFRGAPGVIGDPGRPPMTAWASEFGVQLATGAVRAHVAAFRLDVSHERIQDPVTREISDAGASVRQGLTADLDVQLGSRVGLFGSVTFNDASISATGDPTIRRSASLARQADGAVPAAPTPTPVPTFHVVPLEPGDPVPGVGRYVGRAGIETRPVTRITASATLRFSGPFTPVGEPSVRTSPYSVLDLAGTVRLWADVGLDAELANVFDVRYPEVRASGFVNPGWPRTLRVALRFGRASANALLR